ncbi:response regulator transcription factor [Serratia sp. M24T3]|uniref:response regulator transcription factor n=1 Tax=Serratia sp. M24T3 TaxID=932213 RepID=UPI00025BB244|nr:response regulator transcription factor [Serratia sp. M24T3]EIC82899.1 two-component response regulator [Serratia sp. M24T3]
MKNLVLMEPHSFTCMAIRTLIPEDVKIRGALKGYPPLQSMLDAEMIDIVIMEIYDTNLFPMDGIDFIRRNVHHWNRVTLIICTDVDNIFLIKELMKCKARVLISKKDDIASIQHAIDKGISGDYYCSSNLLAVVNADNNQLSLTSSELRVMSLLLNNNTPIEISEYLGVSYKTVQTHKRNVMQKLGARNSFGLLKIGYEYKAKL